MISTMTQRNEKKSGILKKTAVNAVVVTGVLLFGIYFLICFHDSAQYEGAENSGIEIEGEAGSQKETAEAEEAEADIVGADTVSYDFIGYLDICLQMKNGSTCQDIKLYMKKDKCYFFLPACASSDNLTMHYDESEYAISIDGRKIANGDKLSGWTDTKPYAMNVTYLAGGKSDEYLDSISYSLQFMHSESLPVVFIETANDTMEFLNESKENKEPGEMVCILQDGNVDSAGTLTIHARGQSSFEAAKKSYKISLDEAANFLSLGLSDDWVLQANAYDPVRIRNGMAYQLARDLGLPYAVDSTYIDVYFNGEYGGNYLLCEQIEVEKDRVEIAGEGSYLFAVDPVSEKSDGFTDQYGVEYEIRYPQNNAEESLSWLAERMNIIENLISGCDTWDKYLELQEYIDVDSFVIMYLIDELTNEEDINVRSTFYYIDGKNGKLCAGPAWDFDWSWGNKSEYDIYVNFNLYRDGIPEHLSEIPYFQQAVQEKLTDSKEILEQQGNMADVMAEAVKNSVDMEKIIYGSLTRACVDAGSFDANISYLKWNIEQRAALVTEFVMHPEQYHKVHIEDERTGRVYWIKDGETIPESVIRNICAHYEWADLKFESGKVFWEGYPVLSDLVLYPVEKPPVQETDTAPAEEEAESDAKDGIENTANMEGISMGLLIFIILLAPGFITLLISRDFNPGKDDHMITLLIHYICIDFLILLLVYGSIYIMKGSITLSLSAYDTGEDVYSFGSINVTFLFMLLELIWACVLGCAIKIYQKRKKR